MGATVIHAVIVNVNGLKYTRQLINCLADQTVTYRATVYDQASTETGTREYFATLGGSFDFIQNNEHVGLNRIWNQHFLTTDSKYLSFLNNDLWVPTNFLEDTVAVFEAEPTVGCVIHSTNHPDFAKSMPLWYEILLHPVVQGWDFSLRREAFSLIPDELVTFGGDDWLFAKLYENGWKVAVVLSSPIIHYYARSRRYYIGSRQTEAEAWRRYGYPKLPNCPFSRRMPPADFRIT